jgi:hypothetical protein
MDNLITETFHKIIEMWVQARDEAVICNRLQAQAYAGLIEQHILEESIGTGIDLNDKTKVVCRSLVYNGTVLAQLTRVGGCYRATVVNFQQSP